MMTDNERAAWLADKICNGGDYAKEAAALLQRWPDSPAPQALPLAPSERTMFDIGYEHAGVSPRKYAEVLNPFVALMERELHANSSKGDRPGWLSMTRDRALLEIYYHVSKLSVAMKNDDAPAIAEHSADVANMAMKALDVCGGLAAPPQATLPVSEAVAYVPVHPKNGPLWMDSYPAGRDVSESRSSSYPVMPLYTRAQPQADAAEPVAREDFDKLSADLTRAKNLLVRLYEQVKYDPNRIQPMIEEATGAWFVWGQDRDAAVIEPQSQQVARTSIDDRIAAAQQEIAGWSPEKLASMQLQGPTEDPQAPSAAKKEGQP